MEGKREIGHVTEEERDEIRALFERKSGLTELFRSLTALDREENASLYEKIVGDMGRTSLAFQKWWDEMSQKYKWENIEGYSWEIDFDSCNIYLVKKI